MDQLSADQQREIKKTSSERLRDASIKAGYDEVTVSSYDRNTLTNAFALLLLTPPPVEPQGATGGVEVEAGYPEQPEYPKQTDFNPAGETELDLRKRELMLREKEMKMRELELQNQKEKDNKDAELREKELKLREKELEKQKEKDQ